MGILSTIEVEFPSSHPLEPGEPTFTLRGRDPQAPAAIETWASLRRTAVRLGHKPASDLAVVEEALQLATTMRTWRQERDLP